MDKNAQTIDPTLSKLFTFQIPGPSEREKYDQIRTAAIEFAQTIVDNTVKGPDQTVAIRHVREAVMTANASIALGGAAWPPNDSNR